MPYDGLIPFQGVLPTERKYVKEVKKRPEPNKGVQNDRWTNEYRLNWFGP
jgi:hypothetical protein